MMNILTLILIIMKTKEDVLNILQKFGINAVVLEPIQKGTWVFKTETPPLPEQNIDTRTEIGYKLEYMAVWYKNWLTVFTEIPQDCLSKFRDVLDNVCPEEKINFKLPLMVRAQNDLSTKQILIRVRFDRPAQKRTLNKICWFMQLKFGIFCQNVSINEFIIDYDVSVNSAEVRELWNKEKNKKQYADECGKLSRSLDIPFANVLAMGTDEQLLEKHKVSMRRAAGLIAAQDKSEKKLLYFQIFKGDKESREKAIKSLGIETGNADIMRLDFSMLEEAFK